jgi:hypothetical protein
MPQLSTQPITATPLVGTLENSGAAGRPALGTQAIFSQSVGASLLVDGTTYKQALFIAPCDGCFIKELWLSAAVKIAQGTNTIAFEKYDASANAGANVLSAASIDPDTITAKEGLQHSLTTTTSDLVMDEGDVLWCTLVAGTQSTAGEGYVVTGVVIVPTVL